MVELEINDAVALVRLARPNVRNALDRPMLQTLRALLQDVADDRRVRCVVLAGAGESFCAGGDLRTVREGSAGETMALNGELLDVAEVLDELAVPSVAALHGDALGGGLELALACTLRVATPDARLGFPEVRLGLIPAGGGIARLPRVVGRGAALRLLLTGAIVPAPEARRIGLVDEVGDAMATARAIAANGPLAVRTVVALLRDDVGRAVADAEAALPSVLDSLDAREGVRAFAERRPPIFTGA